MVEGKPSDRLIRYQADEQALDGEEAQLVRNATGDQVETARSTNPNRSDGSATLRNRAGMPDQRQSLPFIRLI